MKKKNNFNQAMYDMFGVGSDDSDEVEEVQEPVSAAAAAPAAPVSEPVSEPVYAAQPEPEGNYQASSGGYEPNTYASGGYASNGYASGGYASGGYASGGYASAGYAAGSYAPNDAYTAAANSGASESTYGSGYGASSFSGYASADPYAGAAASSAAASGYTAASEPENGSTGVVPVASTGGASYSAAPYVLVPATYLAPGTEFEGHFKSKGDVEIAGKFIGDLESEGDVTLRTNMEGNITAMNLSILDGALKGDCHISNRLQINVGSSVEGNVFAGDLMCSGSIVGDSEIKGNSCFDATADVEGNITTVTMSMERGCNISGTLTMKGSRR